MRLLGKIRHLFRPSHPSTANRDFEDFYRKFEDAFRGSEQDIESRLSEHLPLFINLPEALRSLPVLDIGSGRGEFLQLLKDQGINGIGIDTNEAMIDHIHSQGIWAINVDALDYLRTTEPDSIAAITGFHIVEHLEPRYLLELIREAYRTTAPGGFVLFETPNPHSLSVGANTFYLDPTHERPVPFELLQFMLEYCGFSTETTFLHPITNPITLDDTPSVKQLGATIYGFADYSIVARKSSE